MNYSVLLVLLNAMTILLFWYFKRKFTYWQKFNVPYIKPEFPYGNIKGLGTTIHHAKLLQNIYNKLKGKSKFVGFYVFTTPVVVPVDLNFIKSIQIKDFHHFQDRGFYYNERDDPLSAHMFAISGTAWKDLRTTLSPMFTSGKMKNLFHVIVDVANDVQCYLNDVVTNDRIPINISETMGRLTTDVIVNCLFGIQCNSIKEKENVFAKYGRQESVAPKLSVITRIFFTHFKSVSKFLRLKITSDDVDAFFTNFVKDTIDYREKHKIQRRDFMGLMLNIKNNGSSKDSAKKLTFNQIKAQSLLFFLAGFESTAATLSYCLYELALNQKIQAAARLEINKVIEKHNGKLTYDGAMEMTYLEQIILEALRKYPPAANNIRMCTEDYDVPQSNYKIRKGQFLIIPVYAIHHDPEYYPNPKIFDPNRFTTHEVQKRHSATFLSFGQGPRHCIGQRFGSLQAKIGLITFLRIFKVTPCADTKLEIDFCKENKMLIPESNIYLNIEKL